MADIDQSIPVAAAPNKRNSFRNEKWLSNLKSYETQPRKGNDRDLPSEAF